MSVIATLCQPSGVAVLAFYNPIGESRTEPGEREIPRSLFRQGEFRMAQNSLVVLLIIAACGNAFSQQRTEANAGKMCTFTGIYRKDGWTIPGMPAVPAKDDKHPRRRVSDEMPDVFATKLTPVTSEATVTRISCSHDQSGRLQVDEQPVGIIWLFSFDFEGRVFAYGVRYALEKIENGARSDAGMESGFVFYDLDGSGRFTLRKSTLPMPSPDFIPDWVTKPSSIAPNN